MEPGENQSVAKITKKLGDNRFSVELPSNRMLVTKLRGALRKTRIEVGDYVLVETVLNLSVIVYKYDASDAKHIRKTYFAIEEENEPNEYFDAEEETSDTEVNIDDI